MSALILTERATAPSTPTTSKVALYSDNTASPQLKFVDDAGNAIALLDTRNSQAITGKTLTLAAGTTLIAPLTFTSGTNLTAAVAGAIEYDGKAFYSTPNTSNRAVNAAFHFTSTSADFTGTNVNTAQPIFNTTEDVITLPASTSYLMEASLHIETTGTTSHQLGLLFAGTATLTSIAYQATVTNAATEVLGTPQTLWAAVATVTNFSPATATATHHSIWLTGLVRVNGAGTFIPQYQWSAAPGVAGVVLRNSWLKLTPIGDNTIKAVGNWG